MAAQSTSSRALLYFSERVEDAAEAVKGLIGGASTAKYVDTSDDVIRAQLESDRDEIRLEGLKTVITLISKGRDASGYFASVVKLSSNANLEIRKLVYIIVRRYARRQPDVALLGINSFQRDLQDRNEVVRAMALRVLTGLRLKLAASVIQLAIGKCVRDSSFYVRRAAALALIKSRDISPDTHDTFRSHLATLLNDRNPSVLAASVVAWSVLFPSDFELLHSHFRKLCYALVDMDEWGQREVLLALGLYARRCLPEPGPGGKLDRDLELLLMKAEDLLCNPNPAVVTAAARLIYALGPSSGRQVIARPLVRLINSQPDVAFVALLNCHFVSDASPSILSPHIYKFLPASSHREPNYTTALKLQILVRLATPETSEMVLSELVEQAKHHPSEQVAASAVEQAGHWARKSDENQRTSCIKQLLQLLKDRRSRHEVVSQTLTVIRSLVEQSEEKVAVPIIVRLAPLLFSHSSSTTKETKEPKKRLKLVGKMSIHASAARASIYWLLGQYCRLTVDVKAPDGHNVKRTIAQAISLDVLRRAAMNFSREESNAKLQIITLSTKLFTFAPTLPGITPEQNKSLALLHTYVLQLARYDEHFDVRDRARFCKALTGRLEVGLERGIGAGNHQQEDGANGALSDDVQVDGEGQVDEELGGVVLRRNQVMHILFEGKTTSTVVCHSITRTQWPVWDTLDRVLGVSQLDVLDSALPDFFIEPWSDPQTLPSPTVREPSETGRPTTVGLVSTSNNGQSISLGGKSIPVDAQRSLSSEQFGDSPARASPSSTSHPALGQATALSAPFHQSSNTKTRYQDLDAFLDAESDSEEELEAALQIDESDESDVQGSASSDEEEEADEEVEESSEEEEESNESEQHNMEKGDATSAAESITTPSFVPPVEENAWA